MLTTGTPIRSSAPSEPAGDPCVVQDDRSGACAGCSGHGRVRCVPRRRERGLSGYAAVAVPVEEVGDRERRTLAEHRRQELVTGGGRGEIERQGLARRAGASERHLAVEDDPEARADRHADVLRRPPVVGRAHRQRLPCAAGAGDAAVAGTRRPVVPGRCDHERVERKRTRHGSGGRTVLERRVGLRHADDRYPGGVQRISVAVRVDGALEAGDQLVSTGVDGPAACDIPLPACDPNREQCRVLRQAGQPARPSRAHDEAGELGPVPLELGRLVGVGLRRCEIVVLEDVDPLEHRAGEIVVRVLDARVEQGDRHAAAAVAGEAEAGAGGRAGGQVVPLEQLARGRGRVGDADRIDALDLGKALKQRDRAGIERSGEAREHA